MEKIGNSFSLGFTRGPIVRYDLTLLSGGKPTKWNVHLRAAPPLVSSLIVAVAKRESSSKWKILMFNQLLMSEILLLHEFFPVNYFLLLLSQHFFLLFLLAFANIPNRLREKQKLRLTFRRSSDGENLIFRRRYCSSSRNHNYTIFEIARD